jgi:hypothetical protein
MKGLRERVDPGGLKCFRLMFGFCINAVFGLREAVAPARSRRMQRRCQRDAAALQSNMKTIHSLAESVSPAGTPPEEEGPSCANTHRVCLIETGASPSPTIDLLRRSQGGVRRMNQNEQIRA